MAIASIQQAARDALSKHGVPMIIADRAGISWQAVYFWKRNGIPFERCKLVSEITGIPLYRLRHDYFRRDGKLTRLGKVKLARITSDAKKKSVTPDPIRRKASVRKQTNPSRKVQARRSKAPAQQAAGTRM